VFLSRVELNPYRRETMRALASPQVIHAAVMTAFNSFGAPADDRVLWRTDRLGAATYLLVQSQRRPDFHHLIDQFGRPAADQGWDCMDYGPFLDRLAAGQVWRFRLVANPTHAVSEKGRSRGKVYSHVTVAQQTAWLLDRAAGHGFAVVAGPEASALQIRQREQVRFRREKAAVTLDRVTFEGLLRVEDADLLRKALSGGIGRAKAYGCGLMTLVGT